MASAPVMTFSTTQGSTSLRIWSRFYYIHQSVEMLRLV
jgi:hypothetical protein